MPLELSPLPSSVYIWNGGVGGVKRVDDRLTVTVSRSPDPIDHLLISVSESHVLTGRLISGVSVCRVWFIYSLYMFHSGRLTSSGS